MKASKETGSSVVAEMETGNMMDLRELFYCCRRTKKAPKHPYMCSYKFDFNFNNPNITFLLDHIVARLPFTELQRSVDMSFLQQWFSHRHSVIQL